MADWISLLQGGNKPEDMAGAFAQGQATAQATRDAQIAQQQKQVLFQQTQAARTRIQAALSTGDYTTAAAQAFGAGDDKNGTGLITLQQNHYTQAKDNAGSMAEVVRGLSAIPTLEGRQAAIQQAKPFLVQQGLHPQDIDNFVPTDQNLAGLGGVGYSATQRAGDQTNAAKIPIEQMTAQAALDTARAPKVVAPGGALVGLDGSPRFQAQQVVTAPLDSSVHIIGGTQPAGTPGGGTTSPISAEQFYRTGNWGRLPGNQAFASLRRSGSAGTTGAPATAKRSPRN